MAIRPAWHGAISSDDVAGVSEALDKQEFQPGAWNKDYGTPLTMALQSKSTRGLAACRSPPSRS